MKPNFSFAYFVMGTLVGVGLFVATSPMPVSKNSCETYLVSNKVATAYVLRPPPPEPAVCPKPQVTKCPDPVISEETAKAEDTQTEERKRRRKYRRIRRYWK